MVDKTSIQKAVKTALDSAPERKFKESVDITVNLRNIDMAQPKNRIDETIQSKLVLCLHYHKKRKLTQYMVHLFHIFCILKDTIDFGIMSLLNF